MENKTVFLNGQYLPLHDAKVSVLDRGFLFGDGVYEVIPAYFGHLFHFAEHIKRLNNSLAAIRLENPHTLEQWLAICTPLLSSDKNQYIYLQITRGAADKRDHAFPENVSPTVFAMSSDIVPFAGLERGVKALSLDDKRWALCHVKAITLLGNILLRQEAVDKNCAEAILIKDGMVTEGAASNVFAVIDGVLITPPKSCGILPGITRDVILDLAKTNAILCCEAAISFTALKTASEIWLTSSTREIIPVVEFDDCPVGGGKPGAVWQTVNALFQDYKQKTHD